MPIQPIPCKKGPIGWVWHNNLFLSGVYGQVDYLSFKLSRFPLRRALKLEEAQKSVATWQFKGSSVCSKLQCDSLRKSSWSSFFSFSVLVEKRRCEFCIKARMADLILFLPMACTVVSASGDPLYILTQWGVRCIQHSLVLNFEYNHHCCRLPIR